MTPDERAELFTAARAARLASADTSKACICHLRSSVPCPRHAESVESDETHRDSADPALARQEPAQRPLASGGLIAPGSMGWTDDTPPLVIPRWANLTNDHSHDLARSFATQGAKGVRDPRAETSPSTAERAKYLMAIALRWLADRLNPKSETVPPRPRPSTSKIGPGR